VADDHGGTAAERTAAEDAGLTARLQSTTTEARNRLRTALQAIRRTRKPLVEWRGGERDANGVVHMPFPVYHPAVDRLVESLRQANAIAAGFDWMHWDGARRYSVEADVLTAPLEDVVRLVTAIVRGERFCDGTIAAAIEDGRLLAAAQRVLDGSSTGDDVTRGDGPSPASPGMLTKHLVALPPEPTPEEIRDIAGQLFDALQEDRARHLRKKDVEGH